MTLKAESISNDGKSKNDVVRQKKAGSPKDHTGESVFCITGCGWVKVVVGPDNITRCPICKHVIVRKLTYESAAKRFEEFIQFNQETFDHYIFDPTKKMDKLRIPILYGKKFLWVELKSIIEFSNVTATDHSQLELFFNHLDRVCESTKM